MKMLADFDKEGFKKEVITNVKTLFRKPIEEATPQQVFQAVSYAVKDDIIDRWIATHKEYEKKNVKTVYYLSMEFLMGRALGNNLINLTYYDAVKEALDELGFDLNFIEDQEPDAALVMAVSDVLQLVSLIHWQHLVILHTVVVSDTSMVCSSRASRMDIRLRCRMTGSRMATHSRLSVQSTLLKLSSVDMSELRTRMAETTLYRMDISQFVPYLMTFQSSVMATTL